MSRILAIDYGTNRVGTALSDETATLASPLSMVEVRGPKQVARDLADLAQQHEVAEIVMGLPLDLNGDPGEHCEAVQDLAKRLRGRLHLPLHLQDERFTTALAEQSLLAAGRRGQARRERIDCAAATVLLQSFLDSRKR